MLFDGFVIGTFLALVFAILFARLVCLLYLSLRKKISNGTQQTKSDHIPLDGLVLEFHQVHFSSERRLRSLFKIVPWDAAGTLFVTEDAFIFDGQSNRGKRLHLRFLKATTRINYLPQSVFRDGGISWLVIEDGLNRYYFTGEGDSVLELDPATATGMYEALTDISFNEVELLKANL